MENCNIYISFYFFKSYNEYLLSEDSFHLFFLLQKNIEPLVCEEKSRNPDFSAKDCSGFQGGELQPLFVPGWSNTPLWEDLCATKKDDGGAAAVHLSVYF